MSLFVFFFLNGCIHGSTHSNYQHCTYRVCSKFPPGGNKCTRTIKTCKEDHNSKVWTKEDARANTQKLSCLNRAMLDMGRCQEVTWRNIRTAGMCGYPNRWHLLSRLYLKCRIKPKCRRGSQKKKLPWCNNRTEKGSCLYKEKIHIFKWFFGHLGAANYQTVMADMWASGCLITHPADTEEKWSYIWSRVWRAAVKEQSGSQELFCFIPKGII